MADGQVVGVDVGATKTLAARLQGLGLISTARRSTPLGTSGELLDAICEAVRHVDDPEVTAIGVCLPTPIGADHRVLSGAELPLLGVDVEAELTTRLGRPTVIENDGNAAVYAESLRPDGTRIRNLVMMTVGTGIGGGVIIDGRLYRGATGAAGEMGQMIVDATAELVASEGRGRFPRPGALESLASGTTLDRLAQTHHDDTSPAPSPRRGRAPDGPALLQRARMGDPAAIDAFRHIGQQLGLAAASLINVFDPDELVIGGGVSEAGELLLGPLRDTARQRVLPGVGSATVIRPARHGASAGVIGAGLLARAALGPAPARPRPAQV